MRKNRKPNAQPMRVIAKPNAYKVTLTTGETYVSGIVNSRGVAYANALVALGYTGANKPLAASMEVVRPANAPF